MAQSVSLREAFDDFVADKQYQGVSPATISFYSRNWAHFIRDTGIETIAELSPGVIRSWLLAHRGVTPTTLATYDRSLRVTLNWFEKRGYVVESPMAALPKRRTPRTMVDTFTLAEAQAIIKKAKEGRHPRRDVALVTLLLDTGLRIGEAIGVRLDDVDWAESYVHATGKTGPRVVPFGRRSKAALRLYVDRERKASSPRDRKLFLTRSGLPLSVDAGCQQVSRLVRGAGAVVRKAGPHTFRHTFAVEFIRAGGDAFTLQRLLGHTTLDMTRRYVHLADTDLRAAHRKFAVADAWLATGTSDRRRP
jgi:integrase/recombinase XerD